MVYARHDDTDWVINCFVTRMDYRKRGVATRALKGAITAIKKHGGGWIEVVTMAFPHHDPTLAELRRTYRWRSPGWPSTSVTVGPPRKSPASAQSKAVRPRPGRWGTRARCRCSRKPDSHQPSGTNNEAQTPTTQATSLSCVGTSEHLRRDPGSPAR